MKSKSPKTSKTISEAFFWKFAERIGVNGTQFILQIILARLLTPNNYGMLSIMIIFITLANVFIQRGFSTALIQNKNVTEDDYSSVLWVSLFISAVAYGLFFFSAPLISSFYKMPNLTLPFRVLLLVLFPGAINSVQIAKVSKEMNFKIIFLGNFFGILISSVVGIVLALYGLGVWALVTQTILNITISCLVMHSIIDLRFKLVFNKKRVTVLFSFGWKLLVSSLIDTLYQDLSSLVIGKKYSSSTLGYYDRGKQFPQAIISIINTTVQTVLLPAMSKEQDNVKKVKDMVRKSITLSSYLIFPMMAILAGISFPLISLLLTNKWLPSVPFLQINCFVFAFWPIHSCNLQALNAMGRSDIYLKLEVIKKCYGIFALIIAIFLFESPLAIAATGMVTTVVSCFVNAAPNKKIIGYSYSEQMKDISPQFVLSLIIFILEMLLSALNTSLVNIIIIQIFSGIVVYIIVSKLAKFPGLKLVVSYSRPFLSDFLKHL